jgi:hypothetical protein
VLSTLIALLMLAGTLAVAKLLPNVPTTVASSLLLDHHPTFAHVRYVFSRNLLVLAIHVGACYIAILIGREHKPLRENWRRWDRELPAWTKRWALTYALCATTASVALQTTNLGFDLANLSASTHLSNAHLLLLVLPHAIPELVGVFLPLALFIIQAHRGQLDTLSAYTRVAALLALPLIAAAAFIEVYLTPQLIANTLATHTLVFHVI